MSQVQRKILSPIKIIKYVHNNFSKNITKLPIQ